MTEPKGEEDGEIEEDEDQSRLQLQRKGSILSPIKGGLDEVAAEAIGRETRTRARITASKLVSCGLKRTNSKPHDKIRNR